jgi:hypothetical protein
MSAHTDPRLFVDLDCTFIDMSAPGRTYETGPCLAWTRSVEPALASLSAYAADTETRPGAAARVPLMPDAQTLPVGCDAFEIDAPIRILPSSRRPHHAWGTDKLKAFSMVASMLRDVGAYDCLAREYARGLLLGRLCDAWLEGWARTRYMPDLHCRLEVRAHADPALDIDYTWRGVSTDPWWSERLSAAIAHGLTTSPVDLRITSTLRLGDGGRLPPFRDHALQAFGGRASVASHAIGAAFRRIAGWPELSGRRSRRGARSLAALGLGGEKILRHLDHAYATGELSHDLLRLTRLMVQGGEYGDPHAPDR